MTITSKIMWQRGSSSGGGDGGGDGGGGGIGINSLESGNLILGTGTDTPTQIPAETLMVGRPNENYTTLLDTDSSVYADGTQGKADPTGQQAGWYFKNTADVTNKINWYTIANRNPDNIMKFGSLEAVYALVKINGGTQLPFFTIYSKINQNSNQTISGTPFEEITGSGYTATGEFQVTYYNYGSFKLMTLMGNIGEYLYSTASNSGYPFPANSYIKVNDLYYKVGSVQYGSVYQFTALFISEVRDVDGNIVSSPEGDIGMIPAGNSETYVLGDNAQAAAPAASWYRSRKVLSRTDIDVTELHGETVLIHSGDVAGIHPTIPRIELNLDPSSVGDMSDLEDILFGALSTSTGYPENSYDFLVQTIGYVNDLQRTEFLLSAAAQGADAPPPTLEYSNTHHITLDSTNDYIDLTGTGDVLDFSGTKSWSVGIETVDVSSITDNAWMVLFRSGDNVVTLRRGGSNWGIYCYANGNAVCQANTWYAPSAGSKILVQYNHTTNKLEYWLDGFRRANMSLNSNTASNANVVGEFQVGKGGGPSLSGYFYPNYWYGGVNNLMIGSEFLATDAVARYFSTEDISSIEADYPDVIDFCTLGEQTYPTITGLKGTVTGELKNGTEEDFKENS